MIKIILYKQSNYVLDARKIKRELVTFLKSHGIVSDSFVSLSFVDEKQMLVLAKKYYKDNRLHNVFSFVESEVKNFVYPKINTDKMINLGEVIVCYPVAKKEAIDSGMLIDDKIIELVNHSALHLLGIHHKE